jgi:Raf kinase inhibitor-like YbhB/YbcL family protein
MTAHTTVEAAILQVTSPVFAGNQMVPRKYTCDGDDVSPSLEWRSMSKTAKSVAVICDDPDAPSGNFTHWIVYDIPPTVTKLEEGSSGGGTEGVNSFGNVGYGGPCPPAADAAHHYIFHVYALDLEHLGRAGMSRPEVDAAMKGHIVAEGRLTARYQRPGKRP